MATSVTPLRRPVARVTPETLGTFDRVRELVDRLAPENGHVGILDPDLCVYRLPAPSTISKSASFGVTLAVVLQGTKALRLAGHELTVPAGNLLVVTRDGEHTCVATCGSSAEPFLALSFCFSAERVARALLVMSEAGAGESSEEETVPAFVLPCDEPLAGALERLLRTLDDPLDRKLLAPLVRDEILLRLLRSDAAAAVRRGVGRAADSRRILEAMAYIREHHADRLTVEALAKRSAMSPSHFAHRFSAVARVTPMRYLREVRLERARALLLGEGARMSEIAESVGFESSAHFAREFRRRFGLSPSRFSRAR